MIPLLKKLDLSALKDADKKNTHSQKIALVNTKKAEDDWDTSPSDALRVDTIASERIVSGSDFDRLQGRTNFRKTIVKKFPAQNQKTIKQNLPEKIVNYVLDKQTEVEKQQQKSLGIFSDSKIYSAMIKHELQKYDLDIQHFHHPKTLTPQNFAHLNKISAWIIFLSDEEESEFLDHFLECFGDKETLFIFEKLTRRQTSQKVESFVRDNQLERAR